MYVCMYVGGGGVGVIRRGKRPGGAHQRGDGQEHSEVQAGGGGHREGGTRTIQYLLHSPFISFLLWSGDGLQSIPPGHVLRRQLREDQPDLGTGTGYPPGIFIIIIIIFIIIFFFIIGGGSVGSGAERRADRSGGRRPRQDTQLRLGLEYGHVHHLCYIHPPIHGRRT